MLLAGNHRWSTEAQLARVCGGQGCPEEGLLACLLRECIPNSVRSECWPWHACEGCFVWSPHYWWGLRLPAELET